MQPVADQIIAFFLLVLLGNLVGGIFDCYRFFRRIRRLNRWGTNLGDAFFWLIVTVFTYIYLLGSTWGEVRLYVFLGIGLGLFIYLKYLSKYVLISLRHVYLALNKLIKIMIKVFLPPLKLILRILLLPATIAASFFSIFLRGLRHLRTIIKKAGRHLGKKRYPPGPPPQDCP